MKSLYVLIFFTLVAAILFSSCSDGAGVDKSDTTSSDMNEVTTDEISETTEVIKEVAMINDIYAWVNYPESDFYINFNGSSVSEKFTYSYDDAALSIDPEKQTVKALKSGRYEVKAESEHYTATFKVIAQKVNKSMTGANGEDKYYPGKYLAKANDRALQYKQNGNDGKTTVFIGDSFFDSAFWSNFYSVYYGDKDALLLGISATTSYDWECWAEGWLGDISPKNIVMHMGTNNIYDDGDNASTAVSALQRMFTVMHNKLPDTNIYWFGISYRAYNEEKIECASEVNRLMEQWCFERDYITYIDTPSKLTNDMLKDKTHPKLEYYSVFVNALAETDISIERASDISAKIADIQATTSQMIKDGTGNFLVKYKGMTLTSNYIIEGKLDITKTTTNTHVHFAVINGGENRILLWDNQSNGKFKLSIPYNTTDVPADDIYTFTKGKTLTVEWKLVVTDNDAYFYIGDELKLVYAGFNLSNSLKLGSEGAEARFYDMKAITKSADPSEFDAEIAKMADVIEQYDKGYKKRKIRH